jgi:hypothetical protein
MKKHIFWKKGAREARAVFIVLYRSRTMWVKVARDIVSGEKTTILRVISDFAVISRYPTTIKSTPKKISEKSSASPKIFSNPHGDFRIFYSNRASGLPARSACVCETGRFGGFWGPFKYPRG